MFYNFIVEDALLAAAIDNYGTEFDEEPAETQPPSEPASTTESSQPTMNGAAIAPAETETTDSAEPVRSNKFKDIQNYCFYQKGGELERSDRTKSSISVCLNGIVYNKLFFNIVQVNERRQKAKSELLQLETELNELFQVSYRLHTVDKEMIDSINRISCLVKKQREILKMSSQSDQLGLHQCNRYNRTSDFTIEIY